MIINLRNVVFNPLAHVTAIARGIQEGITVFNKFFTKRKGGNENG